MSKYKVEWNKDPIKAVDKAKDKALYAGGVFLHQEMSLRCEVDTGYLRNSISFAIENSQFGLNSSSGESANTSDGIEQAGENEVRIGTGANYAQWVEFGTSFHETLPKRFIRPAYDNNITRIKKLFSEMYESELR